MKHCEASNWWCSKNNAGAIDEMVEINKTEAFQFITKFSSLRLGFRHAFQQWQSRSQSFRWDYGLSVLLFHVYFLLPFKPAVLLSSMLGKSCTAGFKMFDCCPSSTPILLGSEGLEVASQKMLWTVFTGMNDPLKETTVVQSLSFSTSPPLEEVDRPPGADDGRGCTDYI